MLEHKKEYYIDYIIEQTKKVLSIDSPSGYTGKVIDYIAGEYESMGYQPVRTRKGGLVVKLCESNDQDAILFSAHADTLGAMVREVKGNGNLRVLPIGGMNPINGETETCRIITKFNGVYEGTLQINNASVHVNTGYRDAARTYENMEVVVDEMTTSRKQTIELGIQPGDFVCFNPNTIVTKSGFIKSRFLDDKLSVGILLGYAKYLREEGITPSRTVYEYITVYEEVGHGCAASIPQGVTEVISVDMGCVGDGLQCREWQVSICAKDSRSPYNYDVVKGLMEAAIREKLDYAVDVYPHYSSDADAALVSGYDVRHGLIGAGVYASHGYERSHKLGAWNTFCLMAAYAR